MSLDLYPEIIHEGDLSPESFGDELDDICNEIHAATKGVSARICRSSLFDLTIFCP